LPNISIRRAESGFFVVVRSVMDIEIGIVTLTPYRHYYFEHSAAEITNFFEQYARATEPSKLGYLD